MTLHLPSVLRRCLCIITLLIFLFAALPPFSTVAALDTTPKVYTPSASGKKVVGNSKAKIDISNVDQGYLMVRYNGNSKKVKLQITKKGSTTYTYNLSSGSYEAFPLSEGSGTYTVNVYENVSGNQYSLACGESVKVEIKNSLTPFLYSNQYVKFNANSKTVAMGAQIAAGAQNQLQVVDRIYDYVVSNISYDYQKAKTVTSGYLPNVDTILQA